MSKLFLPSSEYTKMYKECVRNNLLIRMSNSGMSSFTIISTSTKVVNRDHCQLFGIGEQEKKLMLPGEAAREVLLYFYPNGFTQHYMYNDTSIAAPMLFKEPIQLKDAIYIDIKSCYCQMYKTLYLDTAFPSLSGTMPLKPVAEFFESYTDNPKFGKKSRNAVTGLLYSSRIVLYNGDEYWRKRIYGKLYNPLVWYSINLMLHEIANVAITLGCAYVATDGYIFPNSSGWNKFMNFLDRSKLKYRAIMGDCEILRFGAYSIAGKALRDIEAEKTTKLYSSVKSELVKYTDGTPNPRRELILRLVAKRERLWNKPLCNIIETDGTNCLSRWVKKI